MSEVIHKCLTKATTAEGHDVRRSLSWLLSRRGILKVTKDALICGDWIIRYPDINEAVLLELNGGMFPGYVLRIKAGQDVYQFGLNPGRFWQGKLPFPCARDCAHIGYSKFTFTVLAALVAFLAFEVWHRLL